ncbi:hypothetical protein O181_110062 [Austropuccinia psidii MF-1]|uniref:Uncharacterized protein n=1 Tax=Austropuccinia psidii MF-1 TaxID=1389203 RepID=A0A9Q3JZ18_9BASI|nr:hypothetical protein [Austropuccinia psidii MF-1]
MNSIKSGIANGSRPISGLLAMSSHARSLQSTSTTEDDLLRLRGTPLQTTYSIQTINKPNCNPSFIATLSLPHIDLVLPIGFNSFTTSASSRSKFKAKQQVAFLAFQALSELHLPPTLYNLTKTIPPQDLIESQEPQPSQQSSDSNSLLIFQLSNGTSINVDQTNLISVLNHLEPLLYSQNRDKYKTGQPLL